MLVVPAVLVVLLAAGCSQSESAPEPVTSGTVAVPTPSEPAPATPTQAPATPSPVATAASPTAEKTPEAPKATGPGDLTFCDYLEQNASAAQRVEDPTQFVELVDGALAVAPGAVRDDLALYAQSVRKLALTVTGSPAQAAKADAWLSRNDAAVQQAQDNLNSYSLSSCGQPFITGEGN